ncbi:hypothetical protein ESA94_18850 [Lacibacter luteus]|uniref:Uncharacterized protein n=1 Tax=Lacibacter luteus TaxID=2508719 RepID=A0A4Q1CEI0_9BACT|nr:hypothetical protein [Lacibacter luteus]RXK58074.1 hypothetical protein ESA94_18850 [Lacibacter luteus]
MKNSLLNAYKKYSSYTSEEIKNDLPTFMGALSFLVEEICNADAASLKQLLTDEVKKDFFSPAPWIRLIIIRNVMSKSPKNKVFFEWAINNLSLFYHPQSRIILELHELINQDS